MQLHKVLYETPGLHQGERSPGNCDGTEVRGTGNTDISRRSHRHWRGEGHGYIWAGRLVTDLPPPACVKQVTVMMSPQPAGLRGITDTL